MHHSVILRKGFSLVEIVLSVALFGALGLILINAFIYGREGSAIALERSRAAELANETIEAVRNIANPTYANLSNYTNGTTYYLSTSANTWQLTTTPSVVDGIFTRSVVFADGPNGTRQVTTNVSWQESLQRTGQISAIGYFANWRQSTAPANKTGIIVYANGGTTTDVMSYKVLQSTGVWTAATPMPDVDSSSTNRVARSVKMYSAQTGSSKVAMSRHFNGTTQFVYASVWNGSVWGNTQLLGQFNSTGNLDIGNYGGDFLANGSFVAVYSDGTNTPRYRTFNGSTWSPQGNLAAMGNSSNYIINMGTEARPAANEAMVYFLGANGDVESSYFANSAWSAYTQHTPNSVSTTSKIVDFAWSAIDNTQGELLYTANPSDRSMRARTFTADNQGSGAWNPVSNTTNQPTGSVVHSVGVSARHSGTVQFIACDKDAQATPDIYCYFLLPGSSGFSNPTNQVITTSTDPGGQRSFDLDYKYLNNSIGLIAYSDNTASGKLKRYTTSTNTWDANPIALPNASGTIQKTRIVAKPNSDDAMIIVADINKNLSSVMLNGTNDTLYAAPTGQAWTVHNTNGPSNNAVWFDFAWDN